MDNFGESSTSTRRGLIGVAAAIAGAAVISAAGAEPAQAAVTYIPESEKGAPMGVLGLDADAKAPWDQLPTSIRTRSETPPVGQDEQVISVLDHGAKASYSFDSTQAFIDVIALLGAQGGTMLLPDAGIMGVLDLPSNIRVLGMGNRTMLKCPDGVNRPTIQLKDASVSNVTLESFKVDGNKMHNTAGGGIELNSFPGTSGLPAGKGGHRLTDITVINAAGHGVRISGPGGSNIQINVQTEACDGHGIFSQAPDSIWIGCDSAQSGGAGFYCAAPNNRYVACNAWFAGSTSPSQGFGWWVTSERQSFVQCQAQDCMADGFLFRDVDGIIGIGLVADSCNGQTKGGAPSSPNLGGVGFDIDRVTNSTIQGQAFDRWDRAGQSHRQAAALKMTNTAPVSTGNAIEIQDAGGNLTRLIGSFGSNRGYVGTDFYGLIANAYTSGGALGAFIGKMPVYDAAGTAIGVVPVYAH